MNDFNRQVIDEFRANEGAVGGPFAGTPMVLLTATGAKSGIERTTPLVCLPEDDGTIYIFGSKAGAPTHPAWYHNVRANPRVVVERGTDRYEAIATELTGEERDAVFARQVGRIAQFGDYQAGTRRTIPVVALRRA